MVAPRRGHTSSGTEPLWLAHRPGYPSHAPRERRLPFPLPRSSDPASASPARARAPGSSCSLERHKSLDSPPPRRRRDPKQQGQEKVQTGEKIRAPEQRARSQQPFNKVQSGLVVRAPLGVVLDQVRREPLDGVRGSFFHERRHAIQQHGHNGGVEVRSDR